MTSRIWAPTYLHMVVTLSMMENWWKLVALWYLWEEWLIDLEKG